MLLFHVIFAMGLYPLFLLLLNHLFGNIIKIKKRKKLSYILFVLIVLAIILTLTLISSETAGVSIYILLTSAFYILLAQLITKKYPQKSITHEKALIFTCCTFLLPICNIIFLFCLGTQVFSNSFVPNSLALFFIIESARWSLTSMLGMYYIVHVRSYKLFIAMGIAMAIPIGIYQLLHHA